MQHKGAVTAGLSGAIWGNLPIKNWAMRLGGQFRMLDGNGLAMQDSGAAWADDTANLGFKTIQTSGSTVTVASDVTKSHNAACLKLLTDGTDGDDCSFQTELPVINIAKGAGRWAFEARVKPSSIADTISSLYVGLTSATLAANSTLSSHDIADVSAVGFFIDEADGDDLRGVVSDASGSAGIANQNVTTAEKFLLKNVDFYNIGAVYDGLRIKLYVTGNKSTDDAGDDKTFLLHEVGEGGSQFPSTTDTDMYYFIGVEGKATGSKLLVEWFAYGHEFIDF